MCRDVYKKELIDLDLLDQNIFHESTVLMMMI